MPNLTVERAARLLCKLDMLDPDSSLSGDGQNFLWMEYAETKVKPIFRAIREPSDQMVDTAITLDPGDVRGMWRAMIDAALANP